jgi:hypothetical protein
MRNQKFDAETSINLNAADYISMIDWQSKGRFHRVHHVRGASERAMGASKEVGTMKGAVAQGELLINTSGKTGPCTVRHPGTAFEPG